MQSVKKQDQPKVVARATITRADGEQIIIEINDQSNFRDFYFWYRRQKGKRNKVLFRTSRRAEAVNLQALADNYIARSKDMPVPAGTRGFVVVYRKAPTPPTVKIVVMKKKLYKHYLQCETDQLPGHKPVIVKTRNLPSIPTASRPASLPGLGAFMHTPQQKMNIVQGGKRRR
jgi:hypothetical protein